MKTCKDCIHYDVCHAVMTMGEIQECAESVCKNFKDKTLVLDLPCKVGQPIYKIWSCGKHGKKIAEFTVNHINIANLPDIEILYSKCCDFSGRRYVAKQSDIGKTIFLTREEAEQALKEHEQ